MFFGRCYWLEPQWHNACDQASLALWWGAETEVGQSKRRMRGVQMKRCPGYNLANERELDRINSEACSTRSYRAYETSKLYKVYTEILCPARPSALWGQSRNIRIKEQQKCIKMPSLKSQKCWHAMSCPPWCSKGNPWRSPDASFLEPGFSPASREQRSSGAIHCGEPGRSVPHW